jgi:hypothetical protein
MQQVVAMQQSSSVRHKPFGAPASPAWHRCSSSRRRVARRAATADTSESSSSSNSSSRRSLLLLSTAAAAAGCCLVSGGAGAARAQSLDDFTTTSSGLKFLDVRVGEGGASPQPGDIVVVHWSGYTKGYQVRGGSVVRAAAAVCARAACHARVLPQPATPAAAVALAPCRRAMPRASASTTRVCATSRTNSCWAAGRCARVSSKESGVVQTEVLRCPGSTGLLL